MATSRPFAYNTGSPILGTLQIGDLAIGVEPIDYSGGVGGVKWWNGPDEDLGYVIAQSVPEGNQPAPGGVTASIGFFRTDEKTEESFVDLANSIQKGVTETFTTGDEAKTWLNANGYWTSFESSINPLITDGLILYFNFAEPTSYPGTGTSVFDLSGNNYTGTLIDIGSGGPYYNYNSETKSMDFFPGPNITQVSPNGSAIDWSNGAPLVRSATSMTLCSLIRATSVPYGNSSFRFSSWLSIDGFLINNGRKFIWNMWNNTGNPINQLIAPTLNVTVAENNSILSDITVVSTNWLDQDLYLVATNESGANGLKLYVNGILVGTNTGLTLQSSPNTNAHLQSGRYGSSSSFSAVFVGKMYTQHLYNRVLSQSEIQDNYNFLKNQFGL